MARDIPLVGVTLSPQVQPNSPWYKLATSKSNSVSPSTVAPTSLATSIGDRAYSFTTRRGRTYELGRIEAGECQVRVNNTDSLFDPNNTSSSFYPNLLPFRPLQITCAYPTTGNLLNDTNLSLVGSDVSRISVGANDANFDLGVISNWYVFTGGLSVASSPAPHSGSYSLQLSPTISAFLDVPCVANKIVTFSIWVRSSSGTSTGAISIYGDGYINSSIAATATTSFTANTTWTRYSVTALTSAPKITVNVKSTANALFVDDVQVEFGSSASTFSITGSTIYELFNGFVERYPQSYQAPNRGEANLVATDAIASLSQVKFSNFYQSLLLQDSSTALYYYPMNEGKDSTYASNAGLYNQLPLTEVLYNDTLALTTFPVFGDTSAQSGIVGAGTTGVAFAGIDSPSDFRVIGTYLNNPSVQDVEFSSGQNYTFSFWAKMAGINNNILFMTNYDNSNTNSTLRNDLSFGIGTTAAGKFCVKVLAFGATGDQNLAVQTATIDQTKFYFVSLNVTYNGGNSYTFALTVDGVTTTATITNGVANLSVKNFFIGGSTALIAGVTTPTVIAHLSIHRGAINYNNYYYTGAYAQYTNSSTPEQTGVKFSNTLNQYSGFKYLPTYHDAGVSQVQQFSPNDTGVADYVQTLADTEGGEWYVAGDGVVTFKDRDSRLKKLSPKVVFGDDAGEVAYDGANLIINYDPTYVYNDIVVERNGGVTAVAQDQNSVVSYFPRSYNRKIYNLADTEAVDMAYFLLSRYKDPFARPDVLTLTPVRNPAIWSTVLSLEIGDLVRVNKRPIGGAAVSVDCFIERIEHSFDAQTADWVTTVALSPVFRYYWNLSSISLVSDSSSSSNTLVVAKGSSLANARDIVAGQLLQGLDSYSNLQSVAVVSGTPTETSTKVTIPISLIGQIDLSSTTINSCVLVGSILFDTTTTVTLSTSALSGTSGKYLIDSEIVSGSVSGSILSITARAQNGTKQTAAGTDDLGAYSYSHSSGATVYYINGTSINPVGTWNEILPNQLTRFPYTIDTIDRTNFSALGSWYNTLNLGTYTNSSGAIKYSTFTVNPLTDFINYPQSDISVGQIVSVTQSATESIAVVYIPPPSGNSVWTVSGYKVTKGSQTLSADIGIDATTVTTSAAVTASAIVVGGEFMTVTAGSGTTSLTVTRGTPDLATWGVLSKSPHYSGDAVYVVVDAGCTGTYAIGSAIIEGYNTSSVINGSARLGF